MRKDIELFIQKVSSNEIREILEKHLADIMLVGKEVVLVLDKKYAMHELHRSSEIEKLVEAVLKVYGEDYSLTLKLELKEPHNERDIFVPHTIRY